MCAWAFGDSFDCYAAPADAINGYWDSGLSPGSASFVAGRFAASRAFWAHPSTTLVKNSSANDASHHIILAFQQTSAITGSALGTYFQLSDGATNQCCIVFRTDGAILLTSATPAGTVLATYTGAFPVTNTWYAFEIEVFISPTAGYMNVRKNGNTVNDFTSATNLVTRPGANSYANKLTFGLQSGTSNGHNIDDLFWRSDASSVAWLGDIKCITRMPASDASVQFSRTPMTNTQTPFAATSTLAVGAGTAKYVPFTAAYDGTISTATVSFATGYTGNLKASIFASSGSAPTTVLGSANVLVNPVTGSNTLTFATPVAVTKGTGYYIGFDSDTTSGSWNTNTTSSPTSTTAYASFPVASPALGSNAATTVCTLTITVGGNFSVVNEPQQDTTTSYVYDSTVGHEDFYGIASIASTPSTVIAVTTRGYMIKSDAGTRTAAVQLKSGGTTVASSTLVLTTSGWQWAWRTDTVDPNTSAAWTPVAVNGVTIGPKVVA